MVIKCSKFESVKPWLIVNQPLQEMITGCNLLRWIHVGMLVGFWITWSGLMHTYADMQRSLCCSQDC